MGPLGDAPLLLVGYRRGVLPALAALGRPACAVVPLGKCPPASPEIDACGEVDLHGPSAAVEEVARRLLAGRRPAAVVALAERTVLAAAQLRRTFDLPGNSPETALACADKVEMKRAMDAAGVPVAPWREVRPETRARELTEGLGLPMVIKPRRDSGGRGQRKLGTAGEVELALTELDRSDGFASGFGWLAEGWVDGVEMSVETFVHGGRPVFGNPTEYFVPRHANVLPAQLDADTWGGLQAFVARALAATGVERGVTHLELFRTATGLVFGELASRPPGGRLMPLLGRAWGFDPWEKLLRLELGEAPAFPARPERTVGVWVLHPGAGTVLSVSGLEEARALPRVRRIVLKVAVGDTIPERVGSGQDVGAIYTEGPTRDSVAEALTRSRDLLRFELG